MAGAWGLSRENFEKSLLIGRGLMARIRDDEVAIGATECSSCKMQMEQATTKPTLHPLKLLALAYGVMPEIHRKLEPSTKKLVVS